MAEIIHFNHGFATLLNNPLNPWSAPSGRASSPPELTNDEMRISDSAKPLDWLRDIRSRIKHPELLEVTDNIAVVAEIRWESARNGEHEFRVLTEAHCQAVIVSGISIGKALKEDKGTKRVQYLRADFEPWNLGEHVFPDPLSHAHASNKNEPRFALSVSPTATHVDFFELLLRNYARKIWQAWAEDVWHARVRERLPGLSAVETMDTIKRAFADNEYRLLCSEPLRALVRQWRKALRKEKSKMSPVRQDESLTPINY